MGKQVGVPTVSGAKGALVDFAYGAGGGLAYGLTSAIFGSGLVGSVVSAVIAGSVIKGERGTIIATMLGFMGILSAFGGGGEAGASQETM